ncbi:MAG: long-chain-fatty-acid--CoA ligase, partial [Chloroflexota bacterium]
YKTALKYGLTATTYQQLDIRTNKMANGLIALGSSSQQRIAYLNKNADSFYELLLGCTKCNTVFVPLNYRLANPEITFIINDSQAETLFVSADYFHQIEAIRGELTRVKTIIALEGDHPRWERFESWRERQSIVDPHSPNHSEDVALQLYTSGTTGRPKGVELTHANLLSALQSGVVRWGFRSDDISLACIPFYHVAGMAWGLAGLYVGAKSRLVRQIEPSELLTIIEQEHVTRTLLVPAVILFLTQTAEIETTDLSSLERIAYGASPIPLELLKVAMRLIKCSFSQAYGLTETTGGITSLPASDHVNPSSNRLNSCGQPLPGVEIRVVDPHGDDLPFGEVGEIICRSDQNMKGYWKRPQATARALRDGWLFTGDAGYLDGDGYLYIHDRINDMIVSGAENVYPAEVESALFEHPAVADVAVIGVPDAKWGETVKAIVVCHAGEAVSAEALIAFARERIAGYKVPRSVDFVEHLPRNPSGKLLKRELRKPYWAGHSRRVN